MPPSTSSPMPATGGAPATFTDASKKILECDYDVNPTILYQAIEAKQWEYAMSIFKGSDANKQAATWCYRKETSGKLRWRLLPIHAAMIFGSPLKLIELLLGEYPHGAQCKDDQGMLPLHLCFRNEVSWEVVEEILTAYPEAYFVKDRKGRTPTSCGMRPVNGSSSQSSQSTRYGGGPGSQKTPFKSAVSVLEAITDIAVSGEIQKIKEESRTILESRVAQLQDTHLQTLTQLKREWHKQRDEAKRTTGNMQDEIESLRQQLDAVQGENAEFNITEDRLNDRIEGLTSELEQKDIELQDKIAEFEEYKTISTVLSPDHVSAEKKNSTTLTLLLESMAEQQREYHTKFRILVGKYEGLAKERKMIMEAFGKDSQGQFNKEVDLIQGFQNWMDEKEENIDSLPLQSTGTDDDDEEEEEKKENEDATPEFLASDSAVKAFLSVDAVIGESGSDVGPSIIDLSEASTPRADP